MRLRGDRPISAPLPSSAAFGGNRRAHGGAAAAAARRRRKFMSKPGARPIWEGEQLLTGVGGAQIRVAAGGRVSWTRQHVQCGSLWGRRLDGADSAARRPVDTAEGQEGGAQWCSGELE